MGVLLFSLKMLKREYKKAMIYALTLMFTISVCYIFFDIMSNDLLVSHEIARGGSSWQEMSIPITTILAFLIIMFCCAMIIFANNYFLMSKTKELAIMATSGMNFFDLTLYLVYQTITIVLVVSPFGLLLGYLFSCITRFIMYSQLNISASLFSVSSVPFINTFFSILAMLFAVLLYSSGYVHRNGISEMLSVQTVNDHNDTRIFKLPRWTYLVIFIIGVLLMLFSEYSVGIFILPAFVGIIGANGVLKYILPDIFTKIKQKKYLNHQIMLISLSNLSYSLKKSIFLVSLYSMSTTVMSALLISQQSNVKEFMTSVIGYAVIILLLSIGLMYKYIGEAMNRKIFFFNLYKLGYTRNKIKKIISKEVNYYYLLIMVIPFLYVLIMVLRCYIHQDITLFFIFILLIILIIPTFIISFITNYSYKKVVFDVLEEGVRYE
jgi:hypothetical protein